MATLQRLLICINAAFFFLVLAPCIEKQTATLTGDAAAVRTCKRQCGAVEVPFPFGLDEDDPSCFYLGDDGFSFSCNTSFHPPMLSWGGLYVTDINIYGGKMRVLMNISVDCYSPSGGITWSVFTHDPSFSFSYTDNIYVGIGCDTMAYIKGYASGDYIGGVTSANFIGGCMSSCESLDQVREGDCSGIGCCQTSIPKGLRGYGSTLGSNNNHSAVLDFNSCSYAFVVEKNNYTFKASDLNMPSTQALPIVLDWCLGTQSCEVARGNHTYACIDEHSRCINATNGPGYLCQCSPGFRGNPYVRDGCQDIDECQDPNICHGGAVCVNTPGNYSCICPLGTTGDPYGYGCEKMPAKQTKSSAVLGISLGISCGLGILLLLFTMAFMRKRLVKKKLQRQRHRFFKNNYDVLLQHLLLSDQNENGIDRVKFFSLKELEKATNKFDSSRIVGNGGHGIVYKGLLDLQVVAIKKSKEETQIDKEQFINEVILLSQISHRNVVKLIGCCLESEVPLLVYEFISNGTLSDHLHQWTHDKSLSWDDRLRIATEISSALAYMHKKANVSIYHRDIKSSNILLDDTLAAKVSDFGASKTLSSNQTHITTNVQGTFGYLDPEYLHTGQLTEKSDVYSLGVILVELMSGMNPSKRNLEGQSNIISQFTRATKEDRLFQVVDASVLEEANWEELQSVADLATASLCLRNNDRPTMKEVELTLEGLMTKKKKKQKQRNKAIFMKDKSSFHVASINIDGSMEVTKNMIMEVDDHGQVALLGNLK